MTCLNDVIHIVRGDDERIAVTLEDENGDEYEMQEGETLTLTVRERPDPACPALIRVVSAANVLTVSHADSENVKPGRYSADIQLNRNDGTVKTVWNGVRGNLHGRTRNWKNFCVDAEVSA